MPQLIVIENNYTKWERTAGIVKPKDMLAKQSQMNLIWEKF